jgi:VWFA-related protein
LAVLLVGPLSGLIGVAWAQQIAAPPVLKTQANLVLVDVVVRAGSGSGSVGGLTRDKFHLLEDGKAQPVTVFEEHLPGTAPEVAPAPALGPNTFSNLPVYTVDSAANVLLLDALNTPLADQQYVRAEMLDYLKSVPKGTRLAVFTLASRLRMVEGFTTDAGEIAKVLRGKGLPRQSSLLDSPPDTMLAGQSSAMTGFGADAMALASMQQFAADVEAERIDQRVLTTLGALQSLARYLKTIPGRKNLVWFSGSFPLALGSDDTLQDTTGNLRNYSPEVQETDALLAAARVAVYPVDGRALMLSPTVSVANDYANPGMGPMGSTSRRNSGNAGSTSAGMNAVKANTKFLQSKDAERGTMQQIAEETGGEAFYDTNGLKDAMAQAVAHGSHYYTLGYVPATKAQDGRYHQIKVSVDGGYAADYRHGYVQSANGSGSGASMGERRLLLALEDGAPPVSELLFKVRAQPVAAAAGTGRHCSLDYGVPVGHLAYVTAGGGVRHGGLEFMVVAYDEFGKKLATLDQSAELTIAPEQWEQFARNGFPMHQEIAVPGTGEIRLRVVVKDEISGRVGALEVTAAGK